MSPTRKVPASEPRKPIGLRAYFAAHAPERPEWFKGIGLEPLPAVKTLSAIAGELESYRKLSPEKRARLLAYLREELSNLPPLSGSIARAVFRIQEEQRGHQEEVKHRNEVRREAQWRWFWADAMMREDGE